MAAHQASHDATELDDVGIGDCVQAANQGVKDGHARRQHHRLRDGDPQDHCQGGTYKQLLGDLKSLQAFGGNLKPIFGCLGKDLFATTEVRIEAAIGKCVLQF